jgi:hypothetical protein
MGGSSVHNLRLSTDTACLNKIKELKNKYESQNTIYERGSISGRNIAVVSGTAGTSKDGGASNLRLSDFHRIHVPAQKSNRSNTNNST